jgi:hypothetical protein
MISLLSFFLITGSFQTDSSLVNIDSILNTHYSKNLNSESFEKGDIIRLPAFSFDLGNGYHFYNSENSFQILRNFLLQNPFLICELRTHTDTQGSADSNLTCSLQKSIQIKEELLRLYKSDTLFSERIIPVGKGESELIVTEEYIDQFSGNQKVIELLHALNRRCELRIHGFLGVGFYKNQTGVSRVFYADTLRNPAYYEDLIMIADRALLEGNYLKALEYYSYAAEMAPVDEHYASQQRDKIKELISKN